MTATEKINTDKKINQNLVCTDHLVSGEKFEILSHESGILRTYPVPENLEKYYESDAYISHRDSSRSLQDKIYQFVKSYMLSKKAKWIRAEIKQGNILDFGAGTGDFLNKMKSFLWKVEGVEPNKMARDLAILKNLDLKSDLYSIRDNKYDVISLWHVLEHLPDYEKKIDEFSELLDEGGILIIAVPNFNSYDCKYYKENWAAWDVPRHLWHFSRNGIQKKMEEKGFLLMKEKPLKFDSFYVSLLSEKNRPGKTNLVNAFLRGLISNLKAKNTGEYSSIAYFFQKKPK
ncbi:class I SAM-dependent methyltransferase [Gramella jeungdoensis]|uniref:Class I SAM-dependent methyltransferase n=1 Tax=Gramella jeungdoensis TaxID=708091 RepID=A0ABT0Z1Q4_9FLAO|nr:class I SAM-dependent methyltransferase [Gramella jeungdoensis]